jgi:protein gp37
MNRTSIEWADYTWNPVTGCKEVSPGCANCYASQLAATRLSSNRAYEGLAGLTDYSHGSVRGKGVWTGAVRTHPDRLNQPRSTHKGGRVFVCDMGDLFYLQVPDSFIARVWDIMAIADQHQFLVLTKRPRRAADLLTDELFCPVFQTGMFQLKWPLSNVWLGTSVEDQKCVDERIPHLIRAPAAIRYLSVEPLLGEVDLAHWMSDIDWVIVGGESGPNARPCELSWVRGVVDQCDEYDVPCFVKQLGSAVGLRERRGGDMAEWPEDLRVREFPSDPVCRPSE